jgi:hypothetical protein
MARTCSTEEDSFWPSSSSVFLLDNPPRCWRIVEEKHNPADGDGLGEPVRVEG